MLLNFEAIKYACAITQYDFTKKLYQGLPESLKGPCRNAPAPEDLFKVDVNAEVVCKKDEDKNHETTAKSLWLAQRSRPDMQLSTGFHCARVRGPNINDWRKLK